MIWLATAIVLVAWFIGLLLKLGPLVNLLLLLALVAVLWNPMRDRSA